MILMEKEDFERLNSLSEKAMIEIATPDEIKELQRLLTIWNELTEYNLIQGFCWPNSKGL